MVKLKFAKQSATTFLSLNICWILTSQSFDKAFFTSVLTLTICFVNKFTTNIKYDSRIIQYNLRVHTRFNLVMTAHNCALTEVRCSIDYKAFDPRPMLSLISPPTPINLGLPFHKTLREVVSIHFTIMSIRLYSIPVNNNVSQIKSQCSWSYISKSTLIAIIHFFFLCMFLMEWTISWAMMIVKPS